MASGRPISHDQALSATLGSADVDGAQLSVVSRAGTNLLVIGQRDSNPSRDQSSVDHARPSRGHCHRACQPIGRGLARCRPIRHAVDRIVRAATLLLDPTTLRLFYRVETSAPAERIFHDIDATTGVVISEWSGLDTADPPATGVGVKGDLKSLAAGAIPGTTSDLTTKVGNNWSLLSADGHIVTLTPTTVTRTSTSTS